MVYKKFSGIYCFENIANGKKYIGQSSRLAKRIYDHLYYLPKNRDSCRLLQSAWNKYGAESFINYIIEECPPEMLNEREEFWIKEKKSHVSENGYNLSYGGEHTTRGLKFTEEQCAKRKQIAIFVTSQESTRLKMSESHKGLRLGMGLSEETKKKISLAKMGTKASPERILQMSEQARGEGNPKSKLTNNDVLSIRRMLKDGIVAKEIMAIFNISKATVSSIKTRRNWSHLEEED